MMGNLESCTEDELRSLAKDIDNRLIVIEKEKHIANVQERVKQNGWCICEEPLDIDYDVLLTSYGLDYTVQTFQFIISTYDKRTSKDARIVSQSDEQNPWVESLKYKYSMNCIKDPTEWDDGPSEWIQGDWDDPDTAKVWHNVWIYINKRSEEYPPVNMCLKVLNDLSVEKWMVKKDGLYNKRGECMLKKVDWPSVDESMDWAILKMYKS